MGDWFWEIATSYFALAIIGTLLAAELVVGYFPLLKWLPILGDYVRLAKLLSFASLAILSLLIGFRISDEREEAKSLRLQLAAKSIDINAANAAADRHDADVAKSAERLKNADQRIAQYADELKKRPVDPKKPLDACILIPADFARRVPDRWSSRR